MTWRLRRAPAKINLGLRVVWRRPDGYHLIDSLVVFAGVGDHVAARPTEGEASLAINGPFAADLAADADNLVLRAAALFHERFGGSAFEFRLWKRLPVASGLGGGSADAAAALRLMAEINGVDPDDAGLAEIALALGADAPMCLRGKPARVGGIGERLAPAPAMPAMWAVLVNSGEAVSTPEAFRRRVGDFSPKATIPHPLEDLPAVAAAIADFGNDLTEPALAIAPGIGDVLIGLRSYVGAQAAAMSGSGGTCFGLFPDRAAAFAAAAALRQAQPEWWAAPALLNAPSD